MDDFYGDLTLSGGERWLEEENEKKINKHNETKEEDTNMQQNDGPAPSSALVSVGSVPGVSSSAAAPMAAATRADAAAGEEEEDEDAPLGSPIDQEEEELEKLVAESEEEEEEEDDQPLNGRKKRRVRVGFSLSGVISDSDIEGYDAEEYAAATGQYRYSENDLEEQRENESATASGLPFSYMTSLELDFLPEFASYSSVYLPIRNLICRQWQKSLSTYLTFDQFLSRSNLDAAKLKNSAKRIFDFLNLHGFINSGLLPIDNNANARRPAEQQMPPTEPHVPTVRRKNNEATLTPAITSETEGKIEDGVKLEDNTVDLSGDVLMQSESATPISAPFPPKRVIVIGAGASGLAAARQLQSFGHQVIVLEGRERVGGRVNTVRGKFTAPVDMGASIMTGLYGSPLNVLSKQMAGGSFEVGFSTMKVMGKSTVEAPATPFKDIMHYIHHDCPLYNSDGALVDKEVDSRMEELWNKLLEAEFPLKLNSGMPCELPADLHLSKAEMDKLRLSNPQDVYSMDVDAGLNLSRKLLGVRVSPSEEKLLDWHAANLEYGCATPLNKLSLAYWDQDDAMAWEGDHALIKPGFGTFIDHLAVDLDIRQNQHVTEIVYPDEQNGPSTGAPIVPVRVHARDNLTGATSIFDGDYVLCTASLGVLKTGDLQFNPPLPTWKTSAIKSLGFGLLNKLILEFPTAFWQGKNNHDMFGYISPGPTEQRGKFYIFWNLHRSTGQPILAALCAGAAAHSMEQETEQTLVSECMRALRAIHSDQAVPEPITTHQTKWSQDPYARGSYSFVAAGNNGKEYDLLARPVGGALYFAGEACNRDYPATVPGAYLSGLRAAGLMQSHIFNWSRSAPPADVLRELSKQHKSDSRSRSDLKANALSRQAVEELERSGGGGDAKALQLKVAELMARQRRRKGIRFDFLKIEEPDSEMIIKSTQQEENIAAKLEQAARLLKQGLFTQTREPVTKVAPTNTRFGHIKRHDGAFERPFDARAPDTAGLPVFASFHEFEGEQFGPTGSIATKHDDPNRHKKTRRELRHEKKRRAASKDKRRAEAERAKKKSKKSSSSRSPDVLIHRHVGKVVLTCAVGVPGAKENRKLLKQVHRKAAGKVVDDWNSKPRGALQVAEWINEKRKQKIEQLVNKYFDIYFSSSSRVHGSSSGGVVSTAASASLAGVNVAAAAEPEA